MLLCFCFELVLIPSEIPLGCISDELELFCKRSGKWAKIFYVQAFMLLHHKYSTQIILKLMAQRVGKDLTSSQTVKLRKKKKENMSFFRHPKSSSWKSSRFYSSGDNGENKRHPKFCVGCRNLSPLPLPILSKTYRRH